MATGIATSQFTGVDFFNIDSLLTEEERAVRDTVRRFVDEHVMPIIGDAYVEGKFPEELIPGMAELGVFGANLPEEYGCAGLNNVAYGLIMQELERGDSGVRSFASVQGALVMYPIYAFGSEEQKKNWLPRMATGEVIGCFGLTEPDYGSNPGGMITMAKEQDDGTGCSTAPRCGSPTARTATSRSSGPRRTATRATQVDPRLHRPDRHARASTAKDQKGKLSLRASDTSELVFQDVHLPKDAILPKIGRPQEPAHVPDAGALRHRLGRDRRGDGVLRGGARATRRTA